MSRWTRRLPDLYEARFDEREDRAKEVVWREIVRYLQRYVDASAPLLDVGCDRGHFIRWAIASERWATDIRDVRDALPAEVRFVQASGLDLAGVVPERPLRDGLHEQLPRAPASRATRSIEQLRVAAEICSDPAAG